MNQFVTEKSQYLIVIQTSMRVAQKVKMMINPASSSLQTKNKTAECPDCDSELDVPCGVEVGEILSCPSCGLELEVKKKTCGGACIEFQELTIEGEDWGE